MSSRHSTSSRATANNTPPPKVKNRRPPNTAFHQQRLQAYTPILTPKKAIPWFLGMGIVFCVIGGLLLWACEMVQDFSIDYTDCHLSPETQANFDPTLPNTLEDMPRGRFSHHFKTDTKWTPQWGHARDNWTYQWPGQPHTLKSNVCILSFEIPNNMEPPVLFFYKLTNFYQNHRRYVKSSDIEQLKGHERTPAQIDSSDCEPLKLAPNGKPYYPCGLVANSMFNDTFDTLTVSNPSSQSGDNVGVYDMTTEGIAHAHERDIYGKAEYAPASVVPPPNWVDMFPEDGYESLTKLPDLSTWYEFQNWMRTAGLPTFTKLAKRNDKETLKTGTYRLKIFDRFPVNIYKGRKEIFISTSTEMGGYNLFLPIAFFILGGACIITGTLFLFIHLYAPRKLGDHALLALLDGPSTATTTGRRGGS